MITSVLVLPHSIEQRSEILYVGCCYLFADQPKITLSPLMVTRKEGEDISLTCNADGNPVPAISSWIIKGSRIDTSNNSRITISKDKEQLNITDVSRTDSGEYQCVATNNLGNTTSKLATLNVQCKYSADIKRKIVPLSIAVKMSQ